jgi:hypothetical protein
VPIAESCPACPEETHRGNVAAAPVFILGCERSGSTWLANIFDAHPDVELFIEPFVSRTGLFAAVPGRNTYLSDAGPALAEAVGAGFVKLPASKYGLFYHPGAPVPLARLDRAVVRAYESLVRLAGGELSRRLGRYAALNLHVLGAPFKSPARSRTAPHYTIVKELRLNFKVGLLAQVFPQARYVVTLRHPGAQIASVLQQFAKGRLGELRESLVALPDCLRSCDRLARYLPANQTIDLTRSVEDTLALWWVANYDVLIGDLRDRGLEHRVVLHEDVSRDPERVVADLFAFCGLEMEPRVTDYLRQSSTREPTMDPALDTHRVSRVYADEAVRRVEPRLRRTIARIAQPERLLREEASGLAPYLSRYFEPDTGSLRTVVAVAA